jgi:cytochrome c peroxidase
LDFWLSQLVPPAPRVARDDPAALRGAELFASDEVGCATCHQGEKLTSAGGHDVGTTDDGRELQVPSLVGVGHRAPFMHDGCAETLLDVFDPSCGGGDAHGHTSQLEASDLADLVAYLESL